MGSKDRLTGPQVAQLADVAYPTLDRWIKSGLVTCERAAAGSGTRREFSIPDVVRVRTVAALRQRGVSLQRVRRMVRELGERWKIDDPLSHNDSRIVLIGDRAFWEDDDEKLFDVLDGQLLAGSLVQVPLGKLVSDTEERVAQMLESENAKGEATSE